MFGEMCKISLKSNSVCLEIRSTSPSKNLFYVNERLRTLKFIDRKMHSKQNGINNLSFVVIFQPVAPTVSELLPAKRFYCQLLNGKQRERFFGTSLAVSGLCRAKFDRNIKFPDGCMHGFNSEMSPKVNDFTSLACFHSEM